MNRYCILFFLAGLISCTKYLDKKPDSSLTVPTSLNDLQALLDYSFVINQTQSPSFGETSSDDYFMPDEMLFTFPQEYQGIYYWQRGDYGIGNDWSHCYFVVYYANFCLEGLQPLDPKLNPDSWNRVKGSALFLRSYNFLNLLWTFAKAYDTATAGSDLGIALKLKNDFNVPTVRASAEACYQQVLTDAKLAAELLPVMASHPFRPSKTAAYGLLARAYLSMRRYDSAYLYADKALQLYSTLMDYNNDPDINWGSSQGNSPFKRFNRETIFYTEMNTNASLSLPFYSKVDTLLLASYAPDDLRRRAYFTTGEVYPVYQGSYAGVYYAYFTGIATDELYLMRGECLARLGQVGAALENLNTLLLTRWNNAVPYVPVAETDAAVVVDRFLEERRKSLVYRGLRWMDIKRLNKENRQIILHRLIAGRSYTLEPNAPYYALPLPIDIIETAGIPQN